jgi:hypothetical protein
MFSCCARLRMVQYDIYYCSRSTRKESAIFVLNVPSAHTYARKELGEVAFRRKRSSGAPVFNIAQLETCLAVPL